MDYLKFVILLWAYSIGASDASPTPVVRDSINPWEAQQSYCGELLERTVQIVCVELKKIRRPRETLAPKVEYARDRYKFLRKKCCDHHCSLNFIKANCPGTRKSAQRKNNADTSQPTKTSKSTIITPKQRLEILERFGKQNNTNGQAPFTRPTSRKTTTSTTTPRPTTTTTTTPRPTTTTTTTTRRPTTTTTTSRPSTTPEYYINDWYYFILPSS